MKILLQFPEGLKKYALEYAKKLEKKGEEVFISSTPCFGACDIAIEEAERLGADKIIHFGHSPFPLKIKTKIPIEYVEWYESFNLEILKITIDKLKKFSPVALITTVQFVPLVPSIIKYYDKYEIKIKIKKGVLTTYKSQVLGCDGTAGNIKGTKAVLYIGSGSFHPLGLKINKPIFIFNPFTKEFRRINKDLEKIRKRYKGAILKALYGNKFLILVSTKPGQFNLEIAKKIKKELGSFNKEAYIVISNTFDPYSLLNLNADVYITTACPRMADDQEMYERPILNLEMYREFLELLKG